MKKKLNKLKSRNKINFGSSGRSQVAIDSEINLIGNEKDRELTRAASAL
jgi:hypothetical protein